MIVTFPDGQLFDSDSAIFAVTFTPQEKAYVSKMGEGDHHLAMGPETTPKEALQDTLALAEKNHAIKAGGEEPTHTPIPAAGGGDAPAGGAAPAAGGGGDAPAGAAPAAG